MNKKIILGIVTLVIIYSSSKAQSTYQKYDSVTRGAEYHLAKSQIQSNVKQIQLLNTTKEKYSIFNDSKTRSQIRAIISSKENENFRLKQKAYLIMNANKIDDINDYNSSLNTLKPTLKQNIR